MSKWIITSILLAYYLFTSGLIFKLNTVQGISSVETPYSFALSSEDTGIVGVYTEDDIRCAKWLVKESNQDITILSDINGHGLLLSMIRNDKRVLWGDNPNFYEGATRGAYFSDLEHYNKCYIFVTSWNTRHQIYIEGGQLGAGLRISNPLPEFDYKEVYRSGKAIVYLKEINEDTQVAK
jgi:uncharacterized membrane protein